jgi:hypothetical protein
MRCRRATPHWLAPLFIAIFASGRAARAEPPATPPETPPTQPPRTQLVAEPAQAKPVETRAVEVVLPAGTPVPVDDQPPLGLLPAPEDSLMDPRMARSWGALPARLFVATTFDLGFVYVRPRVSFGYGKPFTSWVGVDVNAIAVGSGLGAYTGLRLDLPFLDWRLGTRYFSAFSRTYLERQESYSRLDLESATGDAARTLTFETELDVSLRAGPGNILLRGSVSYVAVPSDQPVFEETLHVIVDPPLVWRVRAGYVFAFGAYRQHSLGLVLDALDVPKRDDSRTLRAGPILRIVLSRRVDVRGSFVVTVTSPDRIGLVGGDFTELGVRYRWASE